MNFPCNRESIALIHGKTSANILCRRFFRGIDLYGNGEIYLDITLRLHKRAIGQCHGIRCQIIVCGCH